MNNYLKNSKGIVTPKTVVAIVLLSLFTIFILQNTTVVEIRFFFWKLNMSRVILLLGALFIGLLSGLLIGWEASSKKEKSG